MVQLAESGKGIGYRKEIQSSRVEIGERELLSLGEKSLGVILAEQHPQTGLFPAATAANHSKERHYHHSWARDDASDAMALLDPYVLAIYPVETELGCAIRTEGVKAITGMLSLFSEDPWKSAFRQQVKEEKDQYGRKVIQLTEEAPPIHFLTNGKGCSWPTQDQPDSWGEVLIAETFALKAGLLVLNNEQQKTTHAIAGYLMAIDVPDHEQSSMWEWTRVHNPAPTSSIGICTKGLKEITPHITNPYMQKYLKRAVRKGDEFTTNIYPADFTVSVNHRSITDLATLYGHSLHAFDHLPLSKYFIQANPELGDGQYPGKRRFIGDHYDRGDEEALWPMGRLLESIVYLEKAVGLFLSGLKESAEKFRKKGMVALQSVIELILQVGYNTELLIPKNGELIPSDNHLLWNEALMGQACTRAVVAMRLRAMAA